MRPNVFLAAIGDSNDPLTWSGIPYHFLQEARRQALIDHGLPLSTTQRQWQQRRVAWNLGQVLLLDRPGGYQYSVRFLERLWAPEQSRVVNGVVINCFQLFPPSLVHTVSVEKWFYLDQTLVQLFDHYGDRARVGRRIATEALAREREGYCSARMIVAHSRWAAESLVRDCGVPAAKVRVSVPGANIDPVVYRAWEQSKEAAGGLRHNGPLRLICVGKNWRRKGLDRLLRAFSLARSGGFRGTLDVLGCPRELLPAPLASIEGVNWLGFIDKRMEPSRFLSLVAQCDIGCLLSRAEAGGIAFREYHALGLAVLGTDAGGAPEHMLPGASIAVPADASDAEIADVLLSLDRDRDRVETMRAASWKQRHSCLWEHAVCQILRFWPHAAPLASAAATPAG